MRNILNLEELIKQNPDEVREVYGEKAEGFVKLNEKLDIVINEYPGYEVEIPNLFAMPVGYDLENNLGEVKEAYDELVEGFNEKRMLFVRSSDPNEVSGKFDSKAILYDPEDKEGSFEKWKVARQEVENSGARASLTQIFPNSMSHFPTAINWGFNEKGKSVKIREGFNAFGANMISFYINSVSPIHDSSMMLACEGLATKLSSSNRNKVTSTAESLVMFEMDDSLHVLNGNKINYHLVSSSDRLPLSRDLGVLDEKGNLHIKSINRYELSEERTESGADRMEVANYINMGRTLTPFMREWQKKYSGEWSDEAIPLSILDLFNRINDVCSREIEIEGCFDGDKIYLHQLRYFDAPKKRIIELSDVDKEENLIYREENSVSDYQKFSGALALGNGRFRGDLYVAEDLIDIPGDGILLFADDDFTNLQPKDFAQYERVLLTSFLKNTSDPNSYLGIHALGRTYDLLRGLEAEGVKAMTLGPRFLDYIYNSNTNYLPSNGFLERKIDFQDGVVLLRDVVAECNGLEAQLFYA